MILFRLAIRCRNGTKRASREIRKATRSHAFGPPSSSEGKEPEWLDQTENTRLYGEVIS